MMRATFAVVLVLPACGRLEFDVRATDAAEVDSGASRLTPMFVSKHTSLSSSSQGVGFTIDPTQAGSLVAIGTVSFNVPGTGAPVSTITDNTGSIWRSSGVAGMWSGTQGVVEVWYAANVPAGLQDVLITSNAVTTRSIWLVEVANVDPIDPVEDASALSDGDTGGAPAAPTVTSTGPAFVMSTIILSGFVSATRAPFTAITPDLDGDASAYLEASAAGTYGAVWDAPGSGNFASVTVAFRGAPAP